jgi:hypothetical protein
MTKTRTTPGLARLRKAANAEAIRAAVLADQTNGRADARAKIAAEKAAQTPADAPAPAAAPSAPAHPAKPATARPARFARGVSVPPTDVPIPAETMSGMSRANAAKYREAARGVMPAPPDFSKPSYWPDRKRLQALIDLADAGDAEALRAFAIKTYYSAAIETRPLSAPGYHRHRGAAGLPGGLTEPIGRN